MLGLRVSRPSLAFRGRGLRTSLPTAPTAQGEWVLLELSGIKPKQKLVFITFFLDFPLQEPNLSSQTTNIEIF